MGEDQERRTHILEQYKSLVSDVGNVGTRYATANGFYLSVLTALLGVLAYVGAGKPIDQTTYPVIALVALFAMGICWIWYRTIRFYGRLFGAKFAVLKELELDLPVKVYATEDKRVYGPPDGVEPLTRHEAKVPRFLSWFFGAIAAAALILFLRSLA
jgi:hypothetical protein